MAADLDRVATERFPPTKIPLYQLNSLVRQFDSTMRHARGTTRHVYVKGLARLLAFAKSSSFRFTPKDFADFRSWLFDAEKLSRNTVNVYLTASRRFCEFLIERKILKKNPAWRVHGSAQEYKTLTVKLTEVAAAISNIDRTTLLGKRDFAFLSAMFECGTTISELVNANVGDLKRNSGRTKLETKSQGALGRAELISFPLSVSQAMNDYLSARIIGREDEPLFIAVRGGKASKVRLSFRGARAAMRKHLCFGNERSVTLDSLRTYCVVRLMTRGKSSDEVRSIMRFKSDMPFRKIMYNMPQGGMPFSNKSKSPIGTKTITDLR